MEGGASAPLSSLAFGDGEGVELELVDELREHEIGFICAHDDGIWDAVDEIEHLAEFGWCVCLVAGEDVGPGEIADGQFVDIQETAKTDESDEGIGGKLRYGCKEQGFQVLVLTIVDGTYVDDEKEHGRE
jgi:hypothetical protein